MLNVLYNDIIVEYIYIIVIYILLYILYIQHISTFHINFHFIMGGKKRWMFFPGAKFGCKIEELPKAGQGGRWAVVFWHGG